MFKKIVLLGVAGLFTFGLGKLSYAMSCGEHDGRQHLVQAYTEHEQGVIESSQQAGPTAEAVNIGNKICPVTGEKIDPQNKATYEYEGKIINFCCPACIEEFNKDPQKYLKILEEQQKEKERKGKVKDSSLADPGQHHDMQHRPRLTVE